MDEFSLLIQKILEKKDLNGRETRFAFNELTSGKAGCIRAAAFLTALKAKGETAEEVTFFAKEMKEKAVKVTGICAERLVDTAGTGGDGKKTFNVSTCTAFVASGAGAVVAKHGNRAASSASGSADVLEELGVNMSKSPETARGELENFGISFLFAPAFHPAMKNVARVRRELGFKTVFNILGPLTNPAGAERQLIGAYDDDTAGKIARALTLLGTKKALVVSSDTDEISVSTETQVREVSGENVKKYVLTPEEFGFKITEITGLLAEDKKQSAKTIVKVLNGKSEGSVRNIVLLNAGAAVYASGVATSISQGISLAEKSIDSEKALEKMELLRNGHS